MGEKSNIMWSGAVFSPTGFAKHSREMLKALEKKANVQIDDFYIPREEINSRYFKKFTKPVIKKLDDINNTLTVINDYPKKWDKGHGIRFGFLIHEGSKLPPDWIPYINNVNAVLVPSKATKKLAKWNGVKKPIYIVPEGVDPDFYYPKKIDHDKFRFLFVGSWIGNLIDRKGAGLVIKAFHEEFDEDIELNLKLSTFWMESFDARKQIEKIAKDDRIKIDQSCRSEEEIRSLYQSCDAFVIPTSGEAFGLTIIEAMASGIPVIVTKDKNSGHMDYTKDFVNYVKWEKLRQGNRAFFCEGNMFPVPDLEDLKKQMRYVYENHKKCKEKARKGSDFVRKNFNWDNSANKLIEAYNDFKNNVS